jgi:nitroreductase
VDAFLAVASKREVRSYAPGPLDPAVERRILEAGRLAGSSRNRQGRRFVVLRDPELVERAAQSVFAPENVRGAALVVAIVVAGKGPTDFDAGRAAQNMMIAAANDGVGSTPNGVSDAEQMAAVVGHTPEERVSIVLTFGVPAHPRDPGRHPAEHWIARADRRPFDEVVEER